MTKTLLPGLIVASCLSLVITRADGIPEPGLVLYGTVTNTYGGGNLRQTSGTLQWTVPKPGGGAVNVTVALTNINDQFCYVARVPFESLPTGLPAGITVSANALLLTNAPVTYTRSARIDGTPATLVAPASGTFSFGPADRGRLERVDLLVSIPLLDADGDGMTDAWETQYFGNLGRNGLGDFDGDGLKDLDEFKAGTTPTDPQSVFAFIGVVRLERGGAAVTWSSQAGRRYAVDRSRDVLTGYAPILTNIVATGPSTTAEDRTAGSATPNFYRVRLQE
jgi:hypothetical protein